MADQRRRYNQRDNDPQKEYKRLVRNTKAKMKRVHDEYGVDLSYEIDIPSYDEIKGTDEFDDFVEEMTSFTDRSNLNYQFDRNKWGMVYRLSELERGNELTKEAQENAQEFIDRFKEKTYQVGGKEMPYTIGDRMTLYEKENAAGVTVPNDFDIDAFETRSRLVGRLELLEEKADGVFFDRTQRTMKDNFIKSLKGSFNSEADDIVEMINIMPEDDFFELFMQSAEFTFEDYASDGSIDGTREQAELLRGYLQNYFAGNVDMTLKGLGTLTGGVDEYDKVAVKKNSKRYKDLKRKYPQDFE
jgi:hypothetical protein